MRIFVFVACLLFVLYASGQEKNAYEKITLNTGEIYVGKVVLKTADMIMITTKEGMRYQFQLAEVEKTESENVGTIMVQDRVANNLPTPKSSFGGLVELTAGVSSAKYSFGWSPNTQLSLLFGNKNSFGGNLFLGAGVGYSSSFVAVDAISVAFMPIFVRLQNTLSKKRTAPFVSMDAGYAIALNSSNRGGILIKVSAGIIHKISYKASLIVGIYTGVQSFFGSLTESNEMGTFTYYGKTSMNNMGLKVGLMF